MAGEVSVAREGRANPLNARLGWERRALSLLQVSNNKYRDEGKVTVRETANANWRLYYDGKDTGVTVGRDELSLPRRSKKVRRIY